MRAAESVTCLLPPQPAAATACTALHVPWIGTVALAAAAALWALSCDAAIGVDRERPAAAETETKGTAAAAAPVEGVSSVGCVVFEYPVIAIKERSVI